MTSRTNTPAGRAAPAGGAGRPGASEPSDLERRAILVLLQVSGRDRELARHSLDVASLCVGVARELGLEGGELAAVRCTALLHDVGKILIPPEVLDKPGSLTDRERRLMQDHVVFGERLTARVPGLRDLAPLIRATHERWDGGGYPDGISGAEIPLAARIVAACDSYDAMVTERPYSPAMDGDDAVAEVEACAGSQFCPQAAAALVRSIGGGGAVVPVESAPPAEPPATGRPIAELAPAI